MPSRTVIIASSIGLHARPATVFSRKVNASGIPITVGRVGGITVNGASVLAVMMLGIQCGEEVVLSTEQPGSEEVLAELVALLEVDQDLLAAPFTPMQAVPDPV